MSKNMIHWQNYINYKCYFYISGERLTLVQQEYMTYITVRQGQQKFKKEQVHKLCGVNPVNCLPTAFWPSWVCGMQHI